MSISSAPNFRDIGGFPVESGDVVAHNRIFRSEAIQAPTTEDLLHLQRLGIAHVYDLRSTTERNRAPGNWWRDVGVTPLEFDIMEGIPDHISPWAILREDPSGDGADSAMKTLYRALPQAAAPCVVALLRQLASGPLPILVHCTAGKDRTGFVIAVVEHLLGMSCEDIIADYLDSSGRQTAEAIEATRQMASLHIGAPAGEEMLQVLMGVDQAYLAESFKVIAASHVSVEDYVFHHGLSARDLALAREHCLLPA